LCRISGLGRLNLSPAQAAYMLGFADQRSFFRACKRWFKVLPDRYCDQLFGLAPRAV
jgi:AraC-like DNA-binding protein